MPANIPAEAQPVWTAFTAARDADLARLLSVCSPAKRREIEGEARSDPANLFRELTEFIPEEGLDKLDFTVCRDSRELNRVLGLATSGKHYVAREGFAMILVAGGKTGLPVCRRHGVWMIESNHADPEENWVEQTSPDASPKASPGE